MDEKPIPHQVDKAPACTLPPADPDTEYHCPVCHAVIPSEEIGRKVWCKRCGYLESCCNPV
jgi:hypothetical protein